MFIHLNEFRYRLIYIFIAFLFNFVVLYLYLGEMLYLITKPLTTNLLEHQFLIYTNLSEAFFTTIFLTIYVNILITIIPLIIYHTYYFIVPGLYKHEQKKVAKIIRNILIIYLISIILTHTVLMPIILEFFLTYDFGIDSNIFKIEFQGKIIEYINFILQIYISTIVATQIPIFLIILVKQGLLENKIMLKARSWIIILCFILGALFSPPDILSQILIAVPLYITYEITILVSFFLDITKEYLEKNF